MMESLDNVEYRKTKKDDLMAQHFYKNFIYGHLCDIKTAIYRSKKPPEDPYDRRLKAYANKVL